MGCVWYRILKTALNNSGVKSYRHMAILTDMSVAGEISRASFQRLKNIQGVDKLTETIVSFLFSFL